MSTLAQRRSLLNPTASTPTVAGSATEDTSGSGLNEDWDLLSWAGGGFSDGNEGSEGTESDIEHANSEDGGRGVHGDGNELPPFGDGDGSSGREGLSAGGLEDVDDVPGMPYSEGG